MVRIVKLDISSYWLLPENGCLPPYSCIGPPVTLQLCLEKSKTFFLLVPTYQSYSYIGPHQGIIFMGEKLTISSYWLLPDNGCLPTLHLFWSSSTTLSMSLDRRVKLAISCHTLLPENGCLQQHWSPSNTPLN